MNSDAMLKLIAQSMVSRIVPLLSGSRVVEVLNVEFPRIGGRRPDLVIRLADGRILHLELQSSNDPKMPLRMLEYWLLLRRKYPNARIVQVVLYVGQAAMSMAAGLEEHGLAYSYELRDIRDLDADELLGSPMPSERALALLCRGSKPRQTVERILRSWMDSSPKEWNELITVLMIVSGLRNLAGLVLKEVSNMPLPIEELLSHNPLIQKMMAKAREEAEAKAELAREQAEVARQDAAEQTRRDQADLLRSMVERRFGPVSDALAKRIADADLPQIREWMLRFAGASRLEDVIPLPQHRRRRPH